MKSILVRAFSKANLSLNITGKRDGLHVLDSLMLSLDAFDTVKVTERGDNEINVTFVNADIDPVKNTAYKAASLVQNAIGCGWDIEIEKGIPIGAGLGGSSADGAAVLRALDVFYRLPERGVDMRETALAVGSDVPFMLTGGLARVRGVGEDMYFMGNKLDLFAIGVMGEPVSTAAAYAAFDRLHSELSYCPTDNDKLSELLMTGDKAAVGMFSNALYEPAVSLSPSVAESADILKNAGAHVCLTGSGGMVLGWFTDIAELAACAARLKGKCNYKVFAPAKTGLAHQWLSK